MKRKQEYWDGLMLGLVCGTFIEAVFAASLYLAGFR